MAFCPVNHEFSNALLKALGLQDRRITRLVLTLDVQETVMVQITELAECIDSSALEQLSGKYVVHEVKPVIDTTHLGQDSNVRSYAPAP